MKLYWILWPGTSLITSSTNFTGCSPTSDPNDACDFYLSGLCAVKLGVFQSDESFETYAQQKVSKELTLVQESKNEKTCAAQFIAQSASTTQRLYSKGDVLAKAAVRDFGKVRVSESYYLFA